MICFVGGGCSALVNVFTSGNMPHLNVFFLSKYQFQMVCIGHSLNFGQYLVVGIDTYTFLNGLDKSHFHSLHHTCIQQESFCNCRSDEKIKLHSCNSWAWFTFRRSQYIPKENALYVGTVQYYKAVIRSEADSLCVKQLLSEKFYSESGQLHKLFGKWHKVKEVILRNGFIVYVI